MKTKLIIGISILAFAFSNAQNLTTNLQGCYPLNCNAQNGVLANNPSLNGTLHNITCIPDRNSNPLSACNFTNPINSNNPSAPGTSYIELPNSPLLKPQAISVSGWYKSYNPTNATYLVWTDNGGSSGFEAYSLYIDNSTFYAVKKANSNIATVNWNGSIINNTWYHVVFTIDNSFLKLYVNGALVATATSNFAFQYHPTGKVYLGATAGSGALSNFDAPFSGGMDNVRFYDRVISASEVSNLFVSDPTCSAIGTTVTPNPNTCCLGNLCGSTPNPLAGDYQISTANNDFNFTDDAPLGDKVNVGYTCGSQTIGKLNAYTQNQTNFTPVNGVSPFSSAMHGFSKISAINVNNVGVMGEAENLNLDAKVYGVWGRAIADGGDGVGVRGTSEHLNASKNIGGSFFASHGLFNIGASAIALPSNNNAAPHTYAINYPSGANIGLYASGYLNNTSGPNPAPFSAGPDWAAWFDGDVNIVGSCWQTAGSWQFSDKRLKKEIKPLINISEKIQKLNSYTYKFNTEDFKNRGFDNRQQIGLMAQELKEVFPELVNEDSKGYLAVNYQGMIPVLLQGLKEQQQQINELKALVNSLAGNTGNKQSSTTAIPINLSDKNAVVLNQNVPNPFAESTVITYNIPHNFSKAQIIFSTNEGKVVKAVDITEKSGSLNVFANDLSNGIYQYSLVVDGKTIETKTMIKQ
jgi:Concanavalin A-like lectin/glucanases superfamily/Chaperone of endosialidase